MRLFIEPGFTGYYKNHPLVLVDIGASGGLNPNWKAALKYLQVVGFEPDEREFANLKQKAAAYIKYLNTALHSQPLEIKFHLNRRQQTSSMFKPNRAFLDQFPESERFDIVGSVSIKTDSLDGQLREAGISEGDFIKVDTEGSELFILQGAYETIKNNIFGMEVEVEFAPMHEGQPQFSDVDSFIRGQGFYLFDLKDYYWKRSKGKNLGKTRGQIIFADALYLRTPAAAMSLLESIKDLEKRKAKILKMFCICALYGYFDYANELFECVKDQFSVSEQAAFLGWFKNSRGWYAKIPNFPGRYKISRFFYHLSELFKPTYNGWATIERELGNR